MTVSVMNNLSKWKPKNIQFVAIQGKESGALKSHRLVFQTTYQVQYDSGNQSNYSEMAYLIYLPHDPHFPYTAVLFFRPAPS